MNAPHMTFTPAADYFDALITGIPKAQKRVIIHAMTIWWGPHNEQLVPLLINAVTRGVEVQFVGDIYSKFQALMPRLSRPAGSSWQHTVEVNDRLKKAGVQITYTGKIGLNPYKNRCHSKITLIDDHIYTFGGVNFSDDSFENHDYMLEMHDAAFAEELYRLVHTLQQNPKSPLPDIRQSIGDNATLLFDGGTQRVSAIYETACEIVAQAKKVYFVSQMSPSGKLAELITATDNECYLIRPSQAEPPANIDLIVNGRRYGIKNRYTGEGYIHAKFILTEGHDGSKHVISGSNNFSWRGVKYGTKEIAVHSTDPELWQDFYN
ncbi:MAG: phospholipase D-like domain-containing protein, partial [Candidatus Saccharimonadales bacterium]